MASLSGGGESGGCKRVRVCACGSTLTAVAETRNSHLTSQPINLGAAVAHALGAGYAAQKGTICGSRESAACAVSRARARARVGIGIGVGVGVGIAEEAQDAIFDACAAGA